MIRSLIRLGRITSTTNRYGIIRAQVVVLDENSPEDVILLHPYGINGHPPINSLCVIVSVFGHAENKYAIPFNADDAPKIQSGETIVYSHKGSKVYLKQNGDIDIESIGGNVSVKAKDVKVDATNVDVTATTINVTTTADINVNAANVNLTAATTTITGNAHITGTLTVDGDSTLTGAGTSIAGKIFDTHTHNVSTAPGVTSAPN